MQIVIFIMAVLFVILRVFAKKSEAENKQKAAQQAAHQRAINEAREDERRRKLEEERRLRPRTIAPSITPSVGAGGWHCVCGSDNAAGSVFCTKCGRKKAETMSGSMAYNSSEGAGSGSMAYTSDEGAGPAVSMPYTNTEGGMRGSVVKSSLRHVVKPVTESRHAHTEASMTGGGENCVEAYDQPAGDAYALSTTSHMLPLGMTLSNKNDVARGLIYAEILGKPKALRAR